MRLQDLKELSREHLGRIMDREDIYVAKKNFRFEKATMEGAKKETGLDVIKGLLYIVDEDQTMFGTPDIRPLDSKHFRRLSTIYKVDLHNLNPIIAEEGMSEFEIEDKNFDRGLEKFQEVFDYPIDMDDILLDIIYGTEVVND